MDLYFQDKVCVVTGAGAGIGAALVTALTHAGARVVGLDNNGPALSARAAATPALDTHVVDVTDQAAVVAVVAKIEQTHGPIDLWVNNAGVAALGEVRDLSPATWERSLAVNYTGQLHGVLAVYETMTQRGRGQIANVASIAGVLPCPFQGPYVAAKYAVAGLTQTLRMEGKSLGVKVNLVCPGGVDTPIWDSVSVAGTRITSADELLPIFFWRAKLVPADRAARRILRGIRKNQSFVFTDGYSKACWVCSRWFPRFWLWFYERHTAKSFRRYRVK